MTRCPHCNRVVIPESDAELRRRAQEEYQRRFSSLFSFPVPVPKVLLLASGEKLDGAVEMMGLERYKGENHAD